MFAASFAENAHHISLFMVAVVIILAGFAVGRNMTAGNSMAVMSAVLVMFVAVIFVWEPVIIQNLWDLLFGGGEPEHSHHNSGIHISPETWKYIGIVAGAVVFVVFAFCTAWFIHRRINSPERVEARAEARAAAENEVLERIRQGIADNPDIQTIDRLVRELSAYKSQEAVELLAEAESMRRVLVREEEQAALVPVRRELDEIRFRNVTAGSESTRPPAKEDEYPEDDRWSTHKG